MVEVIVGDGKKRNQSHVDVNYVIGDQAFKTRVRRTLTMSELRETISYMHKGRPIAGLSYEGVDIAGEDLVEDLVIRLGKTPLRVVLSKMVQVTLGWRGQELHMAAREGWTARSSRRRLRSV
jgi:hypothetical protein